MRNTYKWPMRGREIGGNDTPYPARGPLLPWWARKGASASNCGMTETPTSYAHVYWLLNSSLLSFFPLNWVVFFLLLQGNSLKNSDFESC